MNGEALATLAQVVVIVGLVVALVVICWRSDR